MNGQTDKQTVSRELQNVTRSTVVYRKGLKRVEERMAGSNTSSNLKTVVKWREEEFTEIEGERAKRTREK